MSYRIAVFSLVLAAGIVAAGCAPLVAETAPDTIAVQAREAGPETLAAAEQACAARGRKSFGPLSYRCVDAKNVPACQQKAFVFACNVAPDGLRPSTAVAAANSTGDPAPQ
ncbi:MAG: hypothetical protein U1E42_16005 [Rhodospirillales bacterium]